MTDSCRYCMPETGVEKRSHSDILSVEECVETGRAAVNCGVKKFVSPAENLWDGTRFWRFAEAFPPSPALGTV